MYFFCGCLFTCPVKLTGKPKVCPDIFRRPALILSPDDISKPIYKETKRTEVIVRSDRNMLALIV